MKKTLIILSLFLSTFIHAQFNDIGPIGPISIENINVTVAENNYQVVGEPYKIEISFDLIADNVEVGIGNNALAQGGWYVFIKKSTDEAAFPNWPISGSTKFGPRINNPNFIKYSTTTITDGFRFVSEPIAISNVYSEYPSGIYGFLIIGNRGGNSWTFAHPGGPVGYVEEFTQTFTLNDICPTCPNVYEGHDNDNDGIFELNDNCPNTYNPDQLDDDNDGIGNVCDNCPSVPNSNQKDSDYDGVGDDCDNDIDGDGVENSEDDCPTRFGLVSNNGCPGAPNLVVDVDNSGVYSQCLSCNPFLSSFLTSGKRHLIAGGVGSITFSDFVIKNEGDSSSNSAKVDFYYSSDKILTKTGSNADIKLETFTVSRLNINDSYGISTNISGTDIFGYDANSPSTNGNFYILIDIDATNTNYEGDTGGEDDNFLAIPLTFNSSSTASSKSIQKGKFSNELNDLDDSELFEVYDFNGVLLIKTKVDSSEQEDEILDKLSSGYYVIKKETGTRKIYK